MQQIDKSLIEVRFSDNTDSLITEDILIDSYIEEYKKILTKYSAYYKEGTGYKTNKYYEPVMNKAYNYIEHDDFKRIAKEPVKGYDENNRPISTPQSYDYYLSVWSIACMNVEKRYNNSFKLKFDHRYPNDKHKDFDGTLFCYKNQSSWSRRNLPSNQRY